MIVGILINKKIETKFYNKNLNKLHTIEIIK